MKKERGKRERETIQIAKLKVSLTYMEWMCGSVGMACTAMQWKWMRQESLIRLVWGISMNLGIFKKKKKKKRIEIGSVHVILFSYFWRAKNWLEIYICVIVGFNFVVGWRYFFFGGGRGGWSPMVHEYLHPWYHLCLGLLWFCTLYVYVYFD